MPDLGVVNNTLGVFKPGIVFGGVFRVPASGLTATFEGILARLRSATLGKDFDEVVIQPSTKLFTASKDTYVYIDQTTQILTYTEKANGAAKPTQSDIGANSLWVAKVVTDGTNITGVTDLSHKAASRGNIEIVDFLAGFDSTTTAVAGTNFNRPMPRSGRVIAVGGTVVVALAATDAGTITLSIGKNDVFTAVTTGVATFPLSSAVGDRVQAFATAAHRFVAGQSIKAVTAKTTEGGEVNAWIAVEYD